MFPKFCRLWLAAAAALTPFPRLAPLPLISEAVQPPALAGRRPCRLDRRAAPHRSRLRLLRQRQLLSASCSSLVISSVVASTVRFTTLAALVSASSSPFSMVGSPTATSPCLAGGELLSGLVELLAGQGPAPEPLRDDTDVRAVHPLDDVGLAVLLVDHGRVVLANHLPHVRRLEQRPGPPARRRQSRTLPRKRAVVPSQSWRLPRRVIRWTSSTLVFTCSLGRD